MSNKDKHKQELAGYSSALPSNIFPPSAPTFSFEAPAPFFIVKPNPEFLTNRVIVPTDQRKTAEPLPRKAGFTFESPLRPETPSDDEDSEFVPINKPGSFGFTWQQTPTNSPLMSFPQQNTTSAFTPETSTYIEVPSSSEFTFESTPFKSPNLSDLGNSTSLFDTGSAGSSGFFPRGYQNHKSPIPFNLTGAKPSTNMVNERAPPRRDMPPPPNAPNTARPRNTAEDPNAPTLTPVFGRPTMPQSPLRKDNGYMNQSQNQSRYNSNSNIYMPSKPPPPPSFPGDQQQPRHPHMHAAKEFVKSHLPGGQSQSRNNPTAPMPMPVPISRPTGPSYTTTKAAPATSYGSFGNKYEGSFASGFKPVNNKPAAPPANYIPHLQAAGAYKNPKNTIDLTRETIDLTKNDYRTQPLVQTGYGFVDPKKAAEDLKALLEGAIEDEDDKPRTRSRKKKQAAAIAAVAGKGGLSSMFKSLQVAESEPVPEEESEDEDDGTVEGIKVKLLPHQVEGLHWMRDRELGTGKKGTVPKGGILADDMGLGKTLQSVSLIITNPKPDGANLVDGKRKFPAGISKCTLVVAPLALIRQWEAEIKDKVEDSHALRVVVHHGPQRTKNFNDLKKYDVVITTYQILVSEWGNSDEDADGIKVGCFGVHWYRVILDEAHTIKNRNAKATKACYALRSQYRWCLTGTPMQNNLDELQSLIKFLRIKPYDDLPTWKDQIDRPMKNGRGDVAILRLQQYLKIFMKRRTKEILKKEGALNPGGKASKAGEASATGFKVTERKIEKIFAEFSPEERLFYDKLEQRTDKSLKNMMDGSNVNYASALVLLLRLRQACNHPKLCTSKLEKDNEALGAELSTVPATPRKKSAVEEDVDDLADMFGGMGVASKKCEMCQLPISKTLVQMGAVRCEDCEADLLRSTQKPKSRKDRLEQIKQARADKERKAAKAEAKSKSKDKASYPTLPKRGQRNCNVILDSDDEEGSWVVSGDEQGPLHLGKAGGTTDEDAEGTGEDINFSDDDSRDSQDGYESDGGFVANSSINSLPSPSQIRSSQASSQSKSKKSGKKEVITISSDSDSEADSESDPSDAVEVETDSDSDERMPHQHHLSEIITSTKITHLLAILNKEADDHKFIVFSQFTSMLDLIEPFLKRDGYRYTRYDGKMRNDHREAALKMLREEKSCRILLCSLKCGSLGLNLTAATRVVILEPFWNPFVEEQAIDRVHRLTQKVDVVVYKITIKDSVEERILDLQEKKRELARQAIEGGKDGAVGKLGMKEILSLFRRDAEEQPPLPGTGITSYTRGDARSDLIGGTRTLRGRRSEEDYHLDEDRYASARWAKADYVPESERASRESTVSRDSAGSAVDSARVKGKKWKVRGFVEDPVYGRR